MRQIVSLLRHGQDGVALPTVIGALMITTLLAGTTFGVSLEGQHSSSRDRDSKRALAAAEAGLQMAYLKLSEVRPNDGQCVTNAAVSPGTSGAAPGECPSFTAQLGNGASYTYVVATPASGTCATLPGKTDSGKARCITSTGTVNGVRRRLQTRIVATPPHKPFLEAGLIARNDVTIASSETNVYTGIGTNGNISVTNAAKVNGAITLGSPESEWTFNTGGGTTNGQPPVYRDAPYEFPPIDDLYEEAESPTNNNNNALLGTGFYNNGQRSFTMGNNLSYTIPAGTYSFCSFHMQQGSKLRIPAGAVVKIYIDSPARPGSACAVGTGTYQQDNSSEVNREYGADPAQLDLYVYGKAGDSIDNPSIVLGNSVWLYAGIYAPDASLSLVNGGNLIGAATVNNARISNNSDFIWDNRVLNKTIPNTGRTDSLGWFECRRDPTVATDPESGCT